MGEQHNEVPLPVAYVRRRGKQLLIVAGERHPTSRKVEQRILSTFYSRAEALEMLGRGADPASAARFERLVEERCPALRFDWDALRSAVAAEIDHLPATYESRSEAPTARLEAEVLALVRAIHRAPRHASAGSTGGSVEESRAALEYLAEVIADRLAPDAATTAQGPFSWRFAEGPSPAPHEAHAHLVGLWAGGEPERAERGLRVLVAAYPGHTEGHSALGRLALDRGDLPRAETHLRRAVDLGRAALPKVVPRRPAPRTDRALAHARDLGLLAQALVRAARHSEAEATAAELADRGDDRAASLYRAAVAIHRAEWGAAADLCTAHLALSAAHRVINAFAQHELGEPKAGLTALLYAAFSAPRAARLAAGLTVSPARLDLEAEEQAIGVEVSALLDGYLTARGVEARERFARVILDPQVAKLVSSVTQLRRAWHAGKKTDPETGHYLARSMTLEFAAAQLNRLAHLIEGDAGAEAPAPAQADPPRQRELFALDVITGQQPAAKGQRVAVAIEP